MLTFREFRESEVEKEKEKALDVVRKGMNLQGDRDFWDDFLSLCGNSGGMAALLDVPREKITALGGRIGEMRRKVGEADHHDSGK
ncbi:hypothetical protein EBT16_12725, partial [bacterium]|nr:hypothetical protein [bacterium]